MQGKILRILIPIGIAFAAIATAAVLSGIIVRLAPPIAPHISPFLILSAVLACAWFCGYPGGISSVIFLYTVSQVAHRPADPFRLGLMLLLALAISWIANHRRRVEAELRARVAEGTSQLQAVVARLESEVQERKAAEEEIRRLNLRLEQRVDERTRQLEASNHELESFSYSVSHDLRAPLRSIDGFTRILLGSSAHKLDADERALFERVLNATNRMNILIEDLLNLARVTRTAIQEVRVDLSAMASHIAAELGKQRPDVQTHFIVQPGIEAVCDTSLTEVVLHNLLENGWKFSSKAAEPQVEFGATTLDGQRVLYVRDNGAGFNPEYESKLFTPFQRLHRQEEFPGTGIGLATVARIVQRHGGWIRGESQIGKGATFYFTLAGLGSYLPEDPNPPLPRLEPPNSSSVHSTIM